MNKALLILSIAIVLVSCRGIVAGKYTYSDEPISYRKVGNETIIAYDSITHRPYRDVIFVDTVVTVQPSQSLKSKAYTFKLNKTCIYSFVSDGSDSGPIDNQYKGKYSVHGDSITINFIESRSIGYSAKNYANMKIEDRPWKEMKLYNQQEQLFLTSGKKDTLYCTQESGFKSLYLLKDK